MFTAWKNFSTKRMENENADKPKEKVVEFCRETTKIRAVRIVKDFFISY